ncbi:hypothetical protein Peur_016088 [Populus x canadensis]
MISISTTSHVLLMTYKEDLQQSYIESEPRESLQSFNYERQQHVRGLDLGKFLLSRLGESKLNPVPLLWSVESKEQQRPSRL